MTAFTPDIGMKQVVDEATLAEMFADFDSYFLVDRDDGQSLLATGQGFGPYFLSWFPGKTAGARRKSSGDLSKPQVWAAMLDFSRGGTAWRDERSWSELEIAKPGLLDRFIDRCLKLASPKAAPGDGNRADPPKLNRRDLP